MCSLKFQKSDSPVVIGRIIKPHGIKGELKVVIETDDPNRFNLLDYVLLCKKNICERFSLIDARFHNGQIILQLVGIYDREKADLYRGYDVCIKEEDVLPTEENEFYIFDIINLHVKDVSGNSIGIVEDVYTGGHQDILFIRKDNGKLFLLPMVKEFIREINKEKGYIIVSLIEGLEEYS